MIKKIVSALMMLTLLGVLCIPIAGAQGGWEQVVGYGFGDVNNGMVHSLVVFNGELYAGTYNSTTGAEVWRSSNGVNWTQVNTDGFGDANNGGSRHMTAYGGDLYAGTLNTTTGAEVWRGSDGTA